MGLKQMLRDWLEVPPATKPVVAELVVPPVIMPDTDLVELNPGLDDAMALLDAGLIGVTKHAPPPPRHRRRNIDEPARVVDPNDVSALIGSLRK